MRLNMSKNKEKSSKIKKSIVTSALCTGLIFGVGGVLAGCSEAPFTPPEWFAGTATPTNATGVVGDMYVDTDSYILYQKTTNGWAIVMENYGRPGAPGQGIDGEAGKDGNVFFSGTVAPASNDNLSSAEIGDFYLDTENKNLYLKVEDEGEDTDWSLIMEDYAGDGEPGSASTTIQSIKSQYVWDANGKLCLELTIDYAGEKADDVILAPIPDLIKSIQFSLGTTYDMYMQEGDMSGLKMSITMDDGEDTVIPDVSVTADMIISPEGKTAFNKDTAGVYEVDIWYHGQKFDNAGAHYTINVYEEGQAPIIAYNNTLGDNVAILPMNGAGTDILSVSDYTRFLETVEVYGVKANDNGTTPAKTLAQLQIVYPTVITEGNIYTATIKDGDTECGSFEFMPIKYSSLNTDPEGYTVDSIDYMGGDLFVHKFGTIGGDNDNVLIKSILTKTNAKSLVRYSYCSTSTTEENLTYTATQGAGFSNTAVNDSTNQTPQVTQVSVFGKTAPQNINVYVYDPETVEVKAEVYNATTGETVTAMPTASGSMLYVRVTATLFDGCSAIVEARPYYDAGSSGTGFYIDKDCQTKAPAGTLNTATYGTETFYIVWEGRNLPVNVDIYDLEKPQNIDAEGILALGNMKFTMLNPTDEATATFDIKTAILNRVNEIIEREANQLYVEWYEGSSQENGYYTLDASMLSTAETITGITPGKYTVALTYLGAVYNFEIEITTPAIQPYSDVIEYTVDEDLQQYYGFTKVTSYNSHNTVQYPRFAVVTYADGSTEAGYYDPCEQNVPEISMLSIIWYSTSETSNGAVYWLTVSNSANTVSFYNPNGSVYASVGEAMAVYTGEAVLPSSSGLVDGKIELLHKVNNWGGYYDDWYYVAVVTYTNEAGTEDDVTFISVVSQLSDENLTLTIPGVGKFALSTAFDDSSFNTTGTFTVYQEPSA